MKPALLSINKQFLYSVINIFIEYIFKVITGTKFCLLLSLVIRNNRLPKAILIQFCNRYILWNIGANHISHIL